MVLILGNRSSDLESHNPAVPLSPVSLPFYQVLFEFLNILVKHTYLCLNNIPPVPRKPYITVVWRNQFYIYQTKLILIERPKKANNSFKSTVR